MPTQEAIKQFEETLFPAWEAHARKEHVSVGSDYLDNERVTYDRNLAFTYIRCRAPGCKWARGQSTMAARVR